MNGKIYSINRSIKKVFLKDKEEAKIENELEQIVKTLEKAGNQPIDAIAHRVIHDGNKFHDSSIINDEVIAKRHIHMNLVPQAFRMVVKA
jgi:acetate kinase